MQRDGTRASSLDCGFDSVIVSLSPFLHLWPWATRDVDDDKASRRGSHLPLLWSARPNSTAQMHRPRVANDELVVPAVGQRVSSLPIPNKPASYSV